MLFFTNILYILTQMFSFVLTVKIIELMETFFSFSILHSYVTSIYKHQQVFVYVTLYVLGDCCFSP